MLAIFIFLIKLFLELKFSLFSEENGLNLTSRKYVVRGSNMHKIDFSPGGEGGHWPMSQKVQNDHCIFGRVDNYMRKRETIVL